MIARYSHLFVREYRASSSIGKAQLSGLSSWTATAGVDWRRSRGCAERSWSFERLLDYGSCEGEHLTGMIPLLGEGSRAVAHDVEKSGGVR